MRKVGLAPRMVASGIGVFACLLMGPAAAHAADVPALNITYQGSGSLQRGGQMRPCDVGTSSTACSYGTATSTTTFRSWQATFDPMTIQDGAGSTSAPIPSQILDWGDHTISDYYNGCASPCGQNTYHADCSSDLSVNPEGGG